MRSHEVPWRMPGAAGMKLAWTNGGWRLSGAVSVSLSHDIAARSCSWRGRACVRANKRLRGADDEAVAAG